MSTVVSLDPPLPAPEPIRVPVSAGAVRAATAGLGLRLPWPPPTGGCAGLDGRDADPDSAPDIAPDIAPDSGPPWLGAALTSYAALPTQVVVDLTVMTPGGAPRRLVSWQRPVGDDVLALTADRAESGELAWWPRCAWAEELARVAAPATDGRRPETWHASIPLESLLAAREAVTRRRLDLLEALARTGPTLLAGRRLDPPAAAEILTRVAEPDGRLAVTTGHRTAAGGTRLGVTSWLLLGGTWHALTPETDDNGTPLVRLTPTDAARLGSCVAAHLLGSPREPEPSTGGRR